MDNWKIGITAGNEDITNIKKGTPSKYSKQGALEDLSTKYFEGNKAKILENLKQEMVVPYTCLVDPEARYWARGFENMINTSDQTYQYRWGAHLMQVDLMRLEPNLFAVIRRQYVDYYA